MKNVKMRRRIILNIAFYVFTLGGIWVLSYLIYKDVISYDYVNPAALFTFLAILSRRIYQRYRERHVINQSVRSWIDDKERKRH